MPKARSGSYIGLDELKFSGLWIGRCWAQKKLPGPELPSAPASYFFIPKTKSKRASSRNHSQKLNNYDLKWIFIFIMMRCTLECRNFPLVLSLCDQRTVVNASTVLCRLQENSPTSWCFSEIGTFNTKQWKWNKWLQNKMWKKKSVHRPSVRSFHPSIQ